MGDGQKIVIYSVTCTVSWILFYGCGSNLLPHQILSGRQLFSIKIISCQYLKMYTRSFITCTFCDHFNFFFASWLSSWLLQGSFFLLGSTAPTDLTSNQENNWKAGKNKDRATKEGITNNALTDFVGIVVFSGTLGKI